MKTLKQIYCSKHYFQFIKRTTSYKKNSISIIFSFKNKEDILKLSKHYYVARMEELDDLDYLAPQLKPNSKGVAF